LWPCSVGLLKEIKQHRRDERWGRQGNAHKNAPPKVGLPFICKIEGKLCCCKYMALRVEWDKDLCGGRRPNTSGD
jgi:hypothetical protein